MIELHERLSEFSYGYGVTREVEQLLKSIGIRTTPFLPSLLQEAKLAFDVGFNKPGTVLMIQFKLGQSLRRFVRTDKRFPAPNLDRPFWRFILNTAEPDGQYETLLKAEMDGAEAYYAAPRFVDWDQYLAYFQADAVLQNSILVKPSEIRNALIAKGEPDGRHRVAYDLDRIHVCSEPVQIPEVNPEEIGATTLRRIADTPRSLGHIVREITAGLANRHLVRRERTAPREEHEVHEQHEDNEILQAAIDKLPIPDRRSMRARRLETLRHRTASEDDAVAASLGLEVWSLGIQMILASAE